MCIVSLLVQVAVVYFVKNPVGWQKRRLIGFKVSQYNRATFLTQEIDAPVITRDFSKTVQLGPKNTQTIFKWIKFLFLLETVVYFVKNPVGWQKRRLIKFKVFQKLKRWLKNNQSKFWCFNDFLLTTNNPSTWYLFLAFCRIIEGLQSRKPQWNEYCISFSFITWVSFFLKTYVKG